MESEDRVRAASSPEQNRQVDRETMERLRRYEQRSSAEITRRIDELDREWDVERLLEANASTLALTGIALGVLHDRRWFILPGVVASFLLQHALQGWCPPLPLFRRLGVRTRREIDREKYALKVLRGDFSASAAGASAEEALRATQA